TDGKKINDSMERIRAQKHMLEIMDRNPEKECSKLIKQLNSFSFSTQNQAKLYLETRGYSVKEKEGQLALYKFGLLQGEIPVKELAANTNSYSPDKARIKLLHALFDKYRKVYCSTPVATFEPLKGNGLGKPIGYRSEMADFLKEKFGVELIFHGKEGKPPYGYTIIDHSRKNIFKGSEIYPLKDLIREETKEKLRVLNFASQSDKTAYENLTGTSDTVFRFKRLPRQAAYRLKLLSVLEGFPHLQSGLDKYQLNLLVNEKHLYLLDSRERFFIGLDAVLSRAEYNRFAKHWEVPALEEKGKTENNTKIPESRDLFPVQQDYQGTSPEAPENTPTEPEMEPEMPNTNLNLDIHQDVDDEALHGRRRN
ncbi:MAG: relaxase, partial [Anditalea sp.]